jgi:hypothetical protein
MNLFDKLLSLYLQPLWYFHCVGIYIQDKIHDIGMRNKGVTATSYFRGRFWAITAIPLMMAYVFFIPLWLINLVTEKYIFQFGMLFIILMLIMILYATKRHRVIAKYFTKPKFLEF